MLISCAYMLASGPAKSVDQGNCPAYVAKRLDPHRTYLNHSVHTIGQFTLKD